MNMNLKVWLVAGTILGASALGVLAHSGATGIVKERMDNMSSMGQSLKLISEMFRTGTYDSSIIISGAEAMQTHSGDELTRLFPQGSNSMVSKAKDEIWSDWAEFEAMSDELQVLATVLEAAAEHPPLEEENSADMGMGMGSSNAGMGTTDTVSPDAQALAQMSADKIFALVVKNCAACHTKFRVEE